MLASTKLNSNTVEGDAEDWARITAGIAKNDGDCFAAYYHVFFDVMYCDARRLSGGDEATCLDLTQEAMLKAMRGMKVMSKQSELTAWTRVVIRSVVLDYLRKNSRRLIHEQAAGTARVEAWQEGEHSEDLALTMEARRLWLESQLRDTPRELRRLIALRYRLGWTLQKIADQLGIQTGAVDGKIQRLIVKLRAEAARDKDAGELKYDET